MFRFRNLLVVSIATVMLVILMTAGVSAQPAQQGTVTPEATIISTETSVPTIAATSAATTTMTPTAIAPAVSPLATPVSTPSTLPTTGGSDDGPAALSLLLIAAGAVILVGALGMAMSRRSH